MPGVGFQDCVSRVCARYGVPDVGCGVPGVGCQVSTCTGGSPSPLPHCSLYFSLWPPPATKGGVGWSTGAGVRTAVRTHACISRLSDLARGNVCDAPPADAEIMRNGAGMASQIQPLCVSGVDTCKVGRRTILKLSLHRCRQILLHRVARVLDESPVALQREMVQEQERIVGLHTRTPKTAQQPKTM